MLQNISLLILFFSVLTSPAFGGGLNRNLQNQVNSPGMLVNNNPDFSTPSFKNRHSRLLAKPHERTRIPRFIGFPYYSTDGVGNYDNGGSQVVYIIVDGYKKDEPSRPPATMRNPVAPPHIVTLEDSGSSKVHNPGKHPESAVEIRGFEVGGTSITP